MRRILLAGLALLGAGWGCAEAVDAPAPGVLLVTLDTTRADRIGAYGHAEAETPTLDRLARQGVLFENAIAPTPITLPSHASLLTGLYPTTHGVRDNGHFALGEDATLLSEVLAERGWRTAAFVGSYILDARFGLDQGFEVYDGPAMAPGSTSLGAARRADRVADAAIAWLDAVGADEPFFVWIHFYDPHTPYTPPEPWASRHADPYDGEIAFTDAQVGRLLDALARRGRDANLLVAATADHGESLGEHGEDTHGIFVYQAAVQVPLLLAGPPVARFGGLRVAEWVSLASLAPTLLELAGLSREALPDARAPLLLAGDGAAPRDSAAVYVESYLPFHSMRWHALRGIFWSRHKLVQGREAELFDLREDPDETANLAEAQPLLVKELRDRLEAFEAEHADLGLGITRSPGAEEVAQLEVLGYATGSVPGDPLDPALPDPRERTEEHRRFQRAEDEWRRSRHLERQARRATTDRERERKRAAVRALREHALALLAPYEARDNPMLLELIGKLADELGDTERAASALERSVSLQPAVASTHYDLGLAYRKLGRGDEARRCFERAYALVPHASFAVMVARQYVDAGDFAKARPWAERARALAGPSSGIEAAIRIVEEKLAAGG